MCLAVTYHWSGKQQTQYYIEPAANLPVISKQGIILIRWGRRQNESSALPYGGWARHQDILDGKWDRFHPKPIRLAVNQFMEKDIEEVSFWFTVTNGQYIQGLLARHEEDTRIYIVTIEPGINYSRFRRWPKIVVKL